MKYWRKLKENVSQDHLKCSSDSCLYLLLTYVSTYCYLPALKPQKKVEDSVSLHREPCDSA